MDIRPAVRVVAPNLWHVDLSALIFVALAVAWAVYLIPKALEHHDEVVRSRSVDRFSHTMRVLARREPVDRRNARLVVQPTPGPRPRRRRGGAGGRAEAAPAVAPRPRSVRARRDAAAPGRQAPPPRARR